jgi:hypothetical protein
VKQEEKRLYEDEEDGGFGKTRIIMWALILVKRLAKMG